MEHVLLGEASKTEISETNLNILLEQNDTRSYITSEHMWLCFLDVAFFHSYMRSDYRPYSPGQTEESYNTMETLELIWCRVANIYLSSSFSHSF